ncbi:MAG: chorismate synthase [Dehalococcoidia bacterium]
MFRFLTAGESHGKGLIAIVEGVPAGLLLSEEYIAKDMARRQKGYGRGGRMKIEQDRAEIISGVRHGLTLGSPISMSIQNKDWENWKDAMSITPIEGEVERVTRLRPGHADMAGALKYNQQDVRNVLERASARETAARVAVGAVARRFLEEFGVEIHSHTVALGQHGVEETEEINWDRVEESPMRCHDPEMEKLMIAAVDQAKEAGDTVGGVFEVVATGVPVGLGSYVHWDRKLDGRIAQALLSINAMKGVEMGRGFASTRLPGSQVQDVIEPFDSASERRWRHQTNRAGGIEGGMSNGEPIVVRVAVKPISTLGKPLPSVDLVTGEKVQAHYERSDVCQVPSAGVVGEAMLAIVLADAFLEKFGGDHIEENHRNYEVYLKYLERGG